MNSQQKILLVTATLIGLTLYPNISYADPTCTGIPATSDSCCISDAGDMYSSCEDGKVAVKTGSDSCVCKDANTELTELFSILNGIMIPITIIAGLFIIILSGYKILTSQGNPQELQTGKENLTSAIIGLIFVLMAVSILRVIIKALITGDTDPFS